MTPRPYQAYQQRRADRLAAEDRRREFLRQQRLALQAAADHVQQLHQLAARLAADAQRHASRTLTALSDLDAPQLH